MQPLLARYLAHLETALAAGGFAGQFLLMLSSGTLTTVEVARRFPVRLLESGPAAGALVAGYLGARIGRPDLVAFDMGGTTAKISLVQDGRPRITPMIEVARTHRFKPGSGLPVRSTVVDMIEIGAGGGSIADVGTLGQLRVGPQSAGADPGPACYRLGGTRATVTDACVVLGYFDPQAFLGGTMPLDATAARDAVARAGEPLGLDVVGTAWGMFLIVCENMAQAARLYLIERGQDPRRFALMGFGGAGPATAARVGRLLGMSEVLIPPASGLASALGLLVAPPGFDFGQSLAGGLEDLDYPAVEALLAEMETRGREMAVAAGAPPHAIRQERRAEMRYAGQFQDIEIPVPRPLAQDAAARLKANFDRGYTASYGLSLEGYPVEALNWRVLVMGPAPNVDLRAGFGPSGGADVPKGRRRIYLPDTREFAEVPVYDRARLHARSAVDGPVIVQEPEATTVVWPGDRLTVDPHGNLVIRIGGTAGGSPAGAGTGGASMTAFDPVSLEIMWSRLINIVEECWVTMCRTVVLHDHRRGEGLRVRADGRPTRTRSCTRRARCRCSTSLMLAVMAKMLLGVFPTETMRDRGRVHLPTTRGSAPATSSTSPSSRRCSARDALVALVGSIAHCSDIGGTKDSAQRA